MRIVIDMQGAQTESRFRGIGRYTLAFAQAVARNRGENEVILVLSGLFPETIEPLRAAFSDVLPSKNIRVWHAPGPVLEGYPGNDIRREVSELIRESYLASLLPDVVHISSLFEGFWDDATTSIGRLGAEIRTSVVIFDLIPLLNSDTYLKPNPPYEMHYRRKIRYLEKANLCLAISAFSGQEAETTLGIPSDRIVNISTAADQNFKKRVIGEEAAIDLKRKWGIVKPFILCAGASEQRKNLPRLVMAYAALPMDLAASHQLVLSGKMPLDDIETLKALAQKHGVEASSICCTGYVIDEDLITLYNLCALYVFPSWHEGFGLPALEAMSCGAPVIGSNASSLPEVIGLNEALFNPFDVEAISQKIAQVLRSDSLRARLREHGLQRAKSFSWDKTAQRAIAAWEAMQSAQSTQQITWRRVVEHISDIYARLARGIGETLGTYTIPLETVLSRAAECLEKNEQQIGAYWRCVDLPEQLTWRIEGPFDSNYSLALVNRETARALNRLGHNVALHSTEGPGDFEPDERFLAENPDIAEIHRNGYAVDPIEADVVSRNLYPPRVMNMPARLCLLHGYAWEESEVPAEWIESFNHALHGMLVVSTHVRKLMIDNGVTVPIAVCGNGVDHFGSFDPSTRTRAGSKIFHFLHVSSCFPRKGADVMLRAYGRAFRAEDDVALTIKTFPNPHNYIHRWLDDARADDPDFPAVEILEGDYSETQLKRLYERSNVLVAPSRAEGFGLPMAEAMLAGLAVITTGWGGQTDFCTSETAWLVDYTFERAKTHFGLFNSVWAEPNEEHLTSLMKETYHASRADLEKRIKAGQRLLSEKFLWAHVAGRMVKAARSWARRDHGLDPRIGWVTTWNSRCGIASYSQQLVDSIPGKVSILAATSDTVTSEDGPSVRRCWTAGDDHNLAGLSRTISEIEVDIIVVQFNYSLFDFFTLGGFLDEQIDLGRVVVVTLHATTDPVGAPPYKRLIKLVPSLSRCHRLLVHSVGDMNRLKALGITGNVALFPHGVVDYATPSMPLMVKTGEFVVASYGFFLPHKGLLELIDTVALLISRGHRIRLEMINAEYPVVDSRRLINDAYQKIETLGLESYISICTEYLTDEESLTRLSASDLIVFPYQESGESSSAAVRFGIASGRAVAVTPLPIFDDVREAVYILPGQSANAMADGISSLIRDIKAGHPRIAEQAASTSQWRSRHLYTKVGQRLYNILSALQAQYAQCVQE